MERRVDHRAVRFIDPYGVRGSAGVAELVRSERCPGRADLNSQSMARRPNAHVHALLEQKACLEPSTLARKLGEFRSRARVVHLPCRERRQHFAEAASGREVPRSRGIAKVGQADRLGATSRGVHTCPLRSLDDEAHRVRRSVALDAVDLVLRARRGHAHEGPAGALGRADDVRDEQSTRAQGDLSIQIWLYARL